MLFTTQKTGYANTSVTTVMNKTNTGIINCYYICGACSQDTALRHLTFRNHSLCTARLHVTEERLRHATLPLNTDTPLAAPTKAETSRQHTSRPPWTHQELARSQARRQETARAREDGTARYTDLRRRKFDRQERCQCHQLHLKPTKIKLQTPISRKWRNTLCEGLR